GALEPREASAPVDEAADHDGALGARVLDRGLRVVRDGDRGVVDAAPLEAAPAVVRALRDDVHLLDEVLAHVAGPEAAAAPVEAEAPRVPEPVRPDLALLAGL